MTYHYTDEQLNELNWGENVYSVNTTYAEREGETKVVAKSNEQLASDETNIVTAGGQKFQVVATKTDKETGFDGLAVAPIVGGKPDYQSVAIIAAGTDPNNKTENPAMFGGVSRDTASAAISDSDMLSPQYKILDKFVKEVKNDPRYQVTQLSGYSQGSYVLKAGAKYGIPTTTFNSWFMYRSLSSKERDFILKNNSLFRDYRKTMDYTVFLNDLNHPEWYGAEKNAPIYWVAGKNKLSHKIEDWKFDKKTGSVINEKGQVLVSQSVQAVSDTVRVMAHFADLKKQLSAGGLFGSEEIFLDSVQGSVLGAGMAAAARTGADEIASLCRQADAEVEELWSKIDFSSYKYLSPDEVISLFAEQGITHAAIVEEFQSHSDTVKAKVENLAATFDGLNGKVQSVIEQKLATDQQLAKEFQVWQNEM